MDEIGRGTSTYDGISIASAVTQYLATHFKNCPKTLFATHYHELQKLEDQFPGIIKNMQMAVEQKDNQPIFLHSVIEGGASASFGVAVAKLAGVPEEVISNANQILSNLEKRDNTQTTLPNISNEINKSSDINQMYPDSDYLTERLLVKELEKLDIHNMTPLEGLNKIAELKNKLKLAHDVILNEMKDIN